MRMGKRPRSPIKRTTSLKDLSTDLGAATSTAESIPPPPSEELRRDGKLPPSTAPRRGLRRRWSEDPSVVEAAPFLTACGLCKRSLGPGFDTFMYRGEVAFCSSECREEQITIDEKKGRNKCSAPATIKKAELPPPPKSSESSAGSETIVAA